MKSICIWCLFLATMLPFLAQAQSNTSQPIDARLMAKWDKDYLTQMAETNALWLERWTFYLDNAWHLAEYPAEKLTPETPTIHIVDLEHINILAVEATENTKMQWNKQSVYRIAGTNKVLVYESGQAFNQQWNTARGLTSPPKTGVKINSNN